MTRKSPQLIVICSQEMFEAIENYRYSNRIPSRSEALVNLISIGLQHVNDNKAESGKKGAAE